MKLAVLTGSLVVGAVALATALVNQVIADYDDLY